MYIIVLIQFLKLVQQCRSLTYKANNKHKIISFESSNKVIVSVHWTDKLAIATNTHDSYKSGISTYLRAKFASRSAVLKLCSVEP